MRAGGSWATRPCRGLPRIAGYIVIRVRIRPGQRRRRHRGPDRPHHPGGSWGVPAGAREQVQGLNARLCEHPEARDGFGVDVVYTDGRRMPW